MREPKVYLIVGLILYIIFLKQCESSDPLNPVNPLNPVTDTIVLNDTIIEVVVEENPIPVTEIRIEWDTLIQDVDTMAILSDYFIKRIYKDTIEGNGYSLVVDETVKENKLDYRKIVVEITKADTNFTITIPPVRRNKLYYGLSVGGNLNTFSASGELLLLNKKQNMYGIGYDPFNKLGYLRVLHKLSLRRKKKELPL